MGGPRRALADVMAKASKLPAVMWGPSPGARPSPAPGLHAGRERNVLTGAFRLLALCALISGCATYRPASLPAAEPWADLDSQVRVIEEGDVVRVTLASGSTVSGKVLWMQSDQIALDRGGNYDNEELVILASGIDSIEVRRQSDGSIERGWFLTLGAAALFGAYLALHNLGLN